MKVPKVKTDDGYGPDLPEGYEGGYRITDDGDYELIDYDDRDERIAALEAQVAQLLAALQQDA